MRLRILGGMSRGTIFATCLALAAASCVPKGGSASHSEIAHTLITKKADGIPLRISNHTKFIINNVEMINFSGVPGSEQDSLRAHIEPGARVDLLIDRSKLKGDNLTMTIWYLPTPTSTPVQALVLVAADQPYHLEGPTQVDVVEDDMNAPAVAPGYTQDLRLTKDKMEANAAQQAQVASAQAAQVCQKSLDAAHGKAAPGKIKAQGKFKCVFGGGFDGSMNVQMVQLADGKITATLAEFGGGTIANNTWTGIVVGDEIRFAWQGLPSGGSAKIDPGGRAIIGTGVTLENGQCVNWTLTCTR